MTTTQSRFPAIDVGAPAQVLVIDTRGGAGYVIRPVTRLTRLLSRLRGASLDRRLAAGHEPETSRLLATRAQLLMASTSRQRLADDWRELISRAQRPPSGTGRQVPLQRGRIVAAERDIRQLAGVLSAPLAPAARGVAMAGLLLTDGTGPLYNGRAGADLGATVRAIAKAATVAG